MPGTFADFVSKNPSVAQPAAPIPTKGTSFSDFVNTQGIQPNNDVTPADPRASIPQTDPQAGLGTAWSNLLNLSNKAKAGIEENFNPLKLLSGAAKGAIGTVRDLANTGERIMNTPLKAIGLMPKDEKTGIEQLAPNAEQDLKATSNAERLGKVGEFIGEMALPIDEIGKGISNVGKGLEYNKAIKNVDALVGAATQGTSEAAQAAKRALTSFDTTGVKDAASYASAAKERIGAIAEKSSAILRGIDNSPKPVYEYLVKSGKIATNPVVDAVEHLEELYNKTGDTKGIDWIEKIKDKIKFNGLPNAKNTIGLTLEEVNNLAKTYNSEFSEKAFSKRTGEALTNVNAQLIENTRSGLKTAVKNLLPPDARMVFDHLDKSMSDLLTVKDSAETVAEKANALKQKIDQTPGLGGKIKSTIGMVFSPKEWVLNALGKEPGTLNALQISKKLPKYLDLIDIALGKKGGAFEDSVMKMADEMLSKLKPK